MRDEELNRLLSQATIEGYVGPQGSVAVARDVPRQRMPMLIDYQPNGQTTRAAPQQQPPRRGGFGEVYQLEDGTYTNDRAQTGNFAPRGLAAGISELERDLPTAEELQGAERLVQLMGGDITKARNMFAELTGKQLPTGWLPQRAFYASERAYQDDQLGWKKKTSEVGRLESEAALKRLEVQDFPNRVKRETLSLEIQQGQLDAQRRATDPNFLILRDAIPKGYVPQPGGGFTQLPWAEAGRPQTVPEGTTNKIAGNLALLGQIDDVDRQVTGDPGATGVGVGLVGKIPVLGSTINNWMDPAGIDTRALVSNLQSGVLLLRSGAAVSLGEFARSQGFLPEIGDPPDTIRAKLRSLRKAIVTETRALGDSVSPGMGYKGIPGLEQRLQRYESGGIGDLPAGDRRSALPSLEEIDAALRAKGVGPR